MRKWSWIPPLALALAAAALVAPPAAAEESAPPTPEPAVAAAADDGCVTEAAQEIEAILGAVEAPMCPAATPAAAAAPEPILQQGPPGLRRFCQCGCGVGCTTDADCGPGGRCVAFVSCC